MSSNNTTETQNSLYQKHQKIYPRAVFGIFTKLRAVTLFILLGLYFVFPWVSWNDRQAVLFDLPARKFYYFGITFWPQDFFYLALILIVLALTLFLFTALAGRLWCGYSCPQTAWTQVFLWLEHFFEGDRNKRLKLDEQSFSLSKGVRKFAKHTFWLVIAWLTGLTFVGYFTPIGDLLFRVLTFELNFWEAFWIIFFTMATYLNAGWMREQVCFYMCPYARFQSAMFDKDTLIVSYDYNRGEPRGARKKGTQPEALGDCVNCSLCVQVCPTGIDIREGLQYQCIGCAACVDVCDQVMDKLDYDKGLIRYTTEHALEHAKSVIARPRVIFYSILWSVLVIGLMAALMNRIPMELDIIRDRKALFKELPQDYVSNVFTLKFLNMDQKSHTYKISVDGFTGAEISDDTVEYQVEAGSVLAVPVHVQVKKDKLIGVRHTFSFRAESLDNPKYKVKEIATFIGPVPHHAK